MCEVDAVNIWLNLSQFVANKNVYFFRIKVFRFYLLQNIVKVQSFFEEGEIRLSNITLSNCLNIGRDPSRWPLHMISYQTFYLLEPNLSSFITGNQIFMNDVNHIRRWWKRPNKSFSFKNLFADWFCLTWDWDPGCPTLPTYSTLDGRHTDMFVLCSLAIFCRWLGF